MLNPKQERAAYLISTGCAYPEIAQELEITLDLLFRWLQMPHFAAVLNNYRQANLETQRNKLEFLSGKAIAALEEMILTGSAVEKLRAIQIVIDKVDFFQTWEETEPLQNIVEEVPDTAVTSPSSMHKTHEHEALEEIDETILEECLEDLQAYLEGEMPLEKAKARLYPVISPANLNLKSASTILSAVKTQVDANSAKHLYVGKVT
jgi:hypothetical protein